MITQKATKKELMNLKFLITALFVCWATGFLVAQQTTLQEINLRSLDDQKKGMLVLGGWAVANILSGSIASGRTSGATRYFHQMNAGWNAVNLGIAALGFYQASMADPESWSLAESIRRNYSLEKILLLNTGLDVAYMAGGFWMQERAAHTTKNPDRLKGFGRSLVLQGAFLLVFDIASFAVHASDNPQFEALLGQVQFTGNGLLFSMNF